MKTTNTLRSLSFFLVFSGLFASTTSFASELVYVPVEPCRIADTRATIGAIPADSSVSLIAYGGVGELTGQGGSAGGCPNPKPGSTPVSIAANVTAVGNQATGNGNLVAYPYGSTDPGASLVNYKQGTNIANSSIIALCEGDTCTYDFDLKSNFSSVPAIVDVQGYFYPKNMKNVITVSAENADFTNPIDAINSIPTTGPDIPSETNPYLIEIGPGTYDLGSNQLVMREWVDIKGTGSREATVIIGAVSAGTIAPSGLVVGANNTELTDLTIINNGGGTYSVAIYNNSASPKIRRVKARVSGASDTNYAVFNDNASPSMSNVNARGSGGQHSYGVYNNASSPTLKEVTAEGTGGTVDTIGIFNSGGSSPSMNNVTAKASGVADNCYGVITVAASSLPTMNNVFATATCSSNNYAVLNSSGATTVILNSMVEATGGTTNYGVYSNSSIVTIRSSTLVGDTYGLYTFPNTNVKISSSTLIGGAGYTTDNNNCIYVADENNNPLDANCLPPPSP